MNPGIDVASGNIFRTAIAEVNGHEVIGLASTLFDGHDHLLMDDGIPLCFPEAPTEGSIRVFTRKVLFPLYKCTCPKCAEIVKKSHTRKGEL